MYNYLGQDLENDSNSIKSLLESFYKKVPIKDNEKNDQENENDHHSKDNNILTKNNKNIKKNDNSLYQSSDETNDNLIPSDFDPSEQLNDEISENNSDAGSDIDLDKFEMSLQD
jgi:hypothetical protein